MISLSDKALTDRGIPKELDADTFERYTRAAKNCGVEIETLATEGVKYEESDGNVVSVELGCTLILIVYPEDGLRKFWREEARLLLESAAP